MTEYVFTDIKTAAAAGAFCFPSVVPARVLGANSPGNRINVGLIGCGHQSQRIVPSFLVHDDVQLLAVCDVNRQGRGYYWPDQLLGQETARQWVKDVNRMLSRPMREPWGLDLLHVPPLEKTSP